MTTLHIRQDNFQDGNYPIRLTLKRAGRPDHEAESLIQFRITDQEQEDLRWYLEDYLQYAETSEDVTIEQVEAMMRNRGIELYEKVLAANRDTQAIWFSIRNDLADLRVEIATGVAEAASIPWELMRDPETDSPISLRVRSFVRVQSNPNISFVPVSAASDGRVRLLYVACRPSGEQDVELRAVANRLLQDLGTNRALFDIKALRPPTFERLQKELIDANESGRPFHIVHFDGHGMYADLSESRLADWLTGLGQLTLGGQKSGKHGYLLFEHPNEMMRPVDGNTLGQLLHDNRVPMLLLNACQSAMHGSVEGPKTTEDLHEAVRAIGSLAQSVIDQGIPAVLGMRYSVYVVTAAQYIGQLYDSLAKGRSFGQAATEGRKHLELNPDRWIGLQPRPLQDWLVPIAYEAAPVNLFSGISASASDTPELDPVQLNSTLLRYVPEEGFVGRDETVLMLDRAFDNHRVVLLHAYAGQGKTSTAVEFARWYSVTSGLGAQPIVLLASFENHTDLDFVLNQIGQLFSPLLESRGVDWNTINDKNTRLLQVKKILREFPILWIWDNVEPVAGFPEGTESQWTKREQDDLRDFLKLIKLDIACKGKILLTSRRDEQDWLGGIPHRIRMKRMRNSDAAKLALKLGEENNLKPSEVVKWQPLLDYCAGNPLTLRVLVGQAVRMSLHGEAQIKSFVEAIRSGERGIEDADDRQGRDKSLGASLDYGFRHAFNEHELPIIALLHLFQTIVDVDVLKTMGEIDEHSLPELKGMTRDRLMSLLMRARETGVVSHMGSTWFIIHPALPWFLRQIFARCYDGQEGRSASERALRAWVESVGELGDYYHHEFHEGNRAAINPLELEEANLLYARRIARRAKWWRAVVACMQGLDALYNYQGRKPEWARLVDELIPDYCAVDDQPAPGREDEYSLVMQYRVDVARFQAYDLTTATALQKKLVEWNRAKAAVALDASADVPISARQRNRLRTLATSVLSLGNILREQNNENCLQHYLEAANYTRRIEDKAGEAISEFNLGHAYLLVSAIRDLDAAEAAYERSLQLREDNDHLGRSKCIKQVGMVYHERFLESLKQNEGDDTALRHAQTAEERYLEALSLCPKDSLPDLAPIQGQLGNLYRDVGQLDPAREHYEQAAQYFERAGDRYEAGKTRHNIALMYLGVAMRESQRPKRRDNLLRAQAYAEAAMRDYQHYQGRAAQREIEVQLVLKNINQILEQTPG